ncbi:MAG: hypothetical protein KH100_15705 [Dysgonomonas mossii]|uniref:hypothetical protein n=1 Tax=Dysgonomonas mossii TaxID=163665 RepID=UPI001E0087DF|nr:hypothetical protein [Dysgonomonas mossii]MBS7112628.1 hypothetical protein [Dysgonomonas mossii]
MNNKKRIKKKVDIIQRKKQLKLFSLACQYATTIINRAIEAKRKYYHSGGFIPYDVYPEKIIDSHGDEMVLPNFEIKRHPYFLNTHKP